MRAPLSLLPLAGLLAQSIYAQAKDIEVCTQVTRQYITNGDFTTDSDWTASEDYTIVTKSGSDSGYILTENNNRDIPFTADDSSSTTVSFQQAVSDINVGPYYQMDFYWDVIVPDDDFRCDLSIYAIYDDNSRYITGAYRIDSAGESGWTNVLGQWQSTATDITVEFQAVCIGGSGTVRFKDISFKGPEIVCTSQCAVSTLRTSGELIQDGDFSQDDFNDYWSTAGYAYATDDDAPGGGQCMFIPGEYAYYELNQTIADAQAGQTYHASAMWRVMSPVANGVDIPTCSFDFKIVDLENEILLDLAHMTYSLTTTDSGWMSVNGTWNATVSSVIVDIVVTCTADDYNYLPNMEIADVHFNLQTVNCVTPSSSSVASSTPFKSSVSSTPLIRSTPVSPSVSAPPTPVSTPYTTPVTVPTTIPISIPQSTPVSSVAISSSVTVSSVSLASSSRSSAPLQSASRFSSSSLTSSAVSSSVSITTGKPSVSGTSSSLPAGSLASVPTASGSSPTGSSSSGYITAPNSMPIKASVSSARSHTDCSSTSTQTLNHSTSSSITIPGLGQHSTIAPSTPVDSVTSCSSGPLASALPTSTSANDLTISQSGSHLTTSTVFTTQTSTITACPSTVTNCPATAKTTYVITETIVVSTTVCPVTEAEGSPPTATPTSSDGSYTSTILTTRTVTTTLCAATVTNCPARSQTTYTSIQTVVAGTTVITAGPLPTISDSTHTETGVAVTKSTASANEPESASSVGYENIGAGTATISILPDITGVPALNTVSIGSSVSDSTAAQPTTSNEEEVAGSQGHSATVTGVMATTTGSNIDSGATPVSTAGSVTSFGTFSSGMGSNGNGGASSAPSSLSRGYAGASHTPSTTKAAVASSTLATAASASYSYHSTATSMVPAFNGAASLQVAQSGFLGLVAWGIAAFLV
ncbi:uncharacterized protein N7477_001670 [Penicillium maclennaniae]|uniref:uncharacterized protein n=1 Tax=Penicillium maclennaniae TaxID=1343394 RepID=UPI00253FF8FD|nr:uncharacterized protein N7477_001670 [Penicillium maclennaniae]KAJ5681730.1 hypothetical protein N7477_001670 [Penicillium maclennaniae]